MDIQSKCRAKPVTFFCNYVYLCACCPTRQVHSLASEPDDGQQQWPRDIVPDVYVMFIDTCSACLHVLGGARLEVIFP